MKPSDDLLAGARFEAATPRRELGARIVSECTRDLVPAGGLGRAARWGITLATVAAVTAALVAYRLDSVTAWQSALPIVGVWGVGMAGVSVFTLLRPPGRRLSMRACLAVVGVTVLAFVAYMGSLADHSASPLAALGAAATWNCGIYSLVTGGVTVALLMLPWRSTDPLSPSLTGAFLGLCAGLGAGLAAALVCPNHEAWHLYLGHAVALALTVAAAAWLGRRWLAP